MRTFGEIKLQRGYWVLDHVEPHVMIKLKSIFNKIPKGQTNPLSLKHSPEAALDIHWFLERYPLTILEEDRLFLNCEKAGQLEKVSNLELLFKPDYKPAEFKLKLPLRSYQTQAVELFLKVKRMIVGDVVGLGKTPTAIGAMTSETLPAAVVVQTHLQTQWRDQIQKFTDLNVHIVKNGPVYQLPAADVYLFKYTQLQKWINVLVTGIVKTVIFDEIQELRRSDSWRYDSAKKFADSVEYVLGLSATLIYNYGDEAKRKFISGESNLMMISLRSGIGLDGLQDRASIVVIGELDWSPQIHEQIIGRLNRDRTDGSMNQVSAIFLVSNGGSDPGIVDTLGIKSSQAHGIMDPFTSSKPVESDTSRIKELAKRYLAGQQNKKTIEQLDFE